MRAYDGFPTSLEVVVWRILHGFDASFDTSTDGFDGAAHILERTVLAMVCQRAIDGAAPAGITMSLVRRRKSVQPSAVHRFNRWRHDFFRLTPLTAEEIK